MKKANLIVVIGITTVISSSASIIAIMLGTRSRAFQTETSVPLPPQTKAALVPLLQKSLTDNPPHVGERWNIGPQPNVETVIRHSLPLLDGTTNEDGSPATVSDNEYRTLHRSGQLVSLFIMDPKSGLSSDQIMKVWRTRLHGVIPDEEINVADEALKKARDKLATTYDTFRNSDPPEDTDRPLSECFGQIYETRVIALSRKVVSIDLLWMNHRNVIK